MGNVSLAALALMALASCQLLNSAKTGVSSSVSVPLDTTGDPWAESAGWTLSWHDEFDEDAVDTTKWGYETGGGGWGNNELETYTTSNATIGTVDGVRALLITAKRENGGYTSTRMKTQGLRSFKYGRIEARMKLPYGQGIWPAFWMLGGSIDTVGWPGCGEIDIMEMVGGTSNTPGNDAKVYGTLHWGDQTPPAANNSHQQYSAETYALPSGKFADAFHTFGIEWNATTITYWIDGQRTGTATVNTASNGTIFQKDFFILLNLAVGGNWGGNPDGTTVFPQTLAVQWVRVYTQ